MPNKSQFSLSEMIPSLSPVFGGVIPPVNNLIKESAARNSEGVTSGRNRLVAYGNNHSKSGRGNVSSLLGVRQP